jgi:hypothetical protein
LPLFSLAFTEF